MMAKVKVEIIGRIPSKKNNRITLPNGRTVPSRDYLQWQYEARKIVRYTWLGAPSERPIRVVIESNCRNDLDNLQSSILDMLEGIVYENDRQVKEVVARKVGKERGEDYKTTVVVEELDDG